MAIATCPWNCSKTGSSPDMTVEPRLTDAMKGNLNFVKDKVSSDWDKSFISKLEHDWG